MSSFTIPFQAAFGVGLLLLFPGQSRAGGGNSYGHAEVTIGFPNGQVTVGRTWEDNPRQVVVEEVTHKIPENDWDDDDENAHYDDDADGPDRVIIEKRRHCDPRRKVTIIERYEEPVRCNRKVRVVRKVYVDRRSCDRPEVVIYRDSPQRVIHAPSRTAIVAPGRGPRNLFPEDRKRPVRMRGVQTHLVQVGASR